MDEGEITTTPAGMVTLCAAAMVTPLRGPTIATTPSTFTSLLAASTPICSLVPSSRCAPTSKLPPRTPPCELMSSIARIVAF